MTTTKNHSLFCGCLQPTNCDQVNWDAYRLDSTQYNQHAKSKLIYSDILVTGRLVSWTSGPLYSDVDILYTSSQDSANLFLSGGCKVQYDLFQCLT